MSHAIVRGEPTAAQLQLDGVLDSILVEKGDKPSAMQRAKVTLAELLFYCMKRQRDATFLVNGSTGESIITEDVLKGSVSLARSLTAKGATNKNVLVMMKNNQRMPAVYFGVLFARVMPFIMDPNATPSEIKHFLDLIEPCFVFCDREYYQEIKSVIEASKKFSAEIIIAEEEEPMRQFTDGVSDDVDIFQVPSAKQDDVVMMLPTSGTTGLPKAVLLTNKGVIGQLPTMWSFVGPLPLTLSMILSAPNWVSCNIIMCRSVLYNFPLLMTPKKITLEHVAEMLLKFRPTSSFFGPIFGKLFMSLYPREHLSSLILFGLTGSYVSAELMTEAKEKLQESAVLWNCYGTTEAHSHIALTDNDCPYGSCGKIINLFDYKLVNDDGEEVGLGQTGELYLKGDCFIKGYYKDDTSFKSAFTPDGWNKTGDIFYIDENERLYYKERKSIRFLYRNRVVSPEEIENIIFAIPGVRGCVVCGTEKGPTAAVMLFNGCEVTREHIHRVVNNSSLSYYKRLRGGIAFVNALPSSHSGKVKRGDCLKLIQQLIESGQCI